MTSASAGALPLYGTTLDWTCAIAVKSSATRGGVAPGPEVAKVYLPGFALSRATNSFAFAAGKEGCVTSANGVTATMLTGAKSLSGSYGIFCRFGMIESGPLEAASSV